MQKEKNLVEVIFVRHDDGDFGDLKKGTEGFEISEAFPPVPGELDAAIKLMKGCCE